MLTGVAVVDDLDAALDLVAARPALRAVTRDGDLVGAGWVDGGSDRKPSTLEIAGRDRDGPHRTGRRRRPRWANWPPRWPAR